MLPTVVIAGRPNVGKSTLFNAIVGARRSITGDEPGITRDRIHGIGEHAGRRFEIVDTGGLLPDDPEIIPREIFRQARVALDTADRVIFLVDGRAGVTEADRELAGMLRRLGRPVAVAVNKIDTASSDVLVHEFHALGFEDVFSVSAEHRTGVDDLLDRVVATLPSGEEPPPAEGDAIRVAIVGRPNVGKSTLLNALTGADRAIVSPVAGTTRDAVDERVRRDGVDYVFVDTAGIRRKGKTKLMAEKLSVVMARKHIERARAALVVIDAIEGPVASDATIAGYADDAGLPVVLVVNKWDALEKRDKKAFVDRVRQTMKFLEYAPVAFASALTGSGVAQLFGLIRRGWRSAGERIGTGELNRFLTTLEFGRDVKVKYITQAGVHPPTFVVFTDGHGPLHFAMERYLINRLRDRFGFAGTPLAVKTRRR